jgi:uncharacterized repeat protein (TIGR03837 family)
MFCRVIDNHGDLGVCWRLARDLAQRGQQVRLWVDDASALAWMAPAGEPGVVVRAWSDDFPAVEPAVVVVEAFGCELPPEFVARMRHQAATGPAPVWLNLEYLSAEGYVERSHALPSPQLSGPGQGLTKWFFYPGFTPATGGLLREPQLIEARDRFQQTPQSRLDFLREHVGIPSLALREDPAGSVEPLMLLFCYPQAALPAWLDACRAQPHTLLVTPGHSSSEVARWLGLTSPPSPGSLVERDALRLLFLPPVSQPDFDRLLWCCDLNLVRGEDSALRAVWAGRPFLWQLYVQEDDAHLTKLEAFLRHYLADAPPEVRDLIGSAFRRWNAGGSTAPTWPLERSAWRAWQDWARQRCSHWATSSDLTTRLLDFVAQKTHDKSNEPPQS